MRDSSPRIRGSLNLALLLAASAASAALLVAASRASNWTWLVASALGFSLTANTLFSLLHESVHGLLHPSAAVNEWGGRLAAAWFPTGLQVQRGFHLTHHQANRSPEEQFDLLHEGDVAWLKRAQWYAILTGVYWAVAVAGVVTWLFVPRALRLRLLRARDSRVARQTGSRAYLDALDALPPLAARGEIVLALALQVALFLALGLSWRGWLACYAAFALAWSSFQYADHAFSPLDARNGAWNLRVDPIRRIFLLGYQHHHAHHLRPETPWTELGARVDPNQPRPPFWRVWLTMWGGPRRPQELERLRRQVIEGPATARFDVIVVFALFFAIFFCGANFVSGFVPWRIHVDLPFERALPFVPAAAFVYLSVDLLLLLTPLLIEERRELLRTCLTLMVETLIGAAFFILLPVELRFAHEPPVGSAVGAVYLFADRLCLERNLLPSLHVAFAVTAALACGRRRGGVAKTLLWIWCASIAASTILLHEHHVADVAGGGALALLTWRAVGRLDSVRGATDAFDADLICLREFVRVSRRGRRYLVIAAALLGRSLPRWNRRRLLRSGFCFLQWIDDLLDGDRACAREPLQVVDEVVAAIGSGRFGRSDLMRLARSFTTDLRAVGGEAAVESAIALIRVMQGDRRRVLERCVSSRDELLAIQRRTFSLSVDLMLLAGDAQVRASDVPELIDAFGWCSTMRDLEEDLARGLFNVPRDVLEASAAIAPAKDYEQWVATAPVQEWMRSEFERARSLLQRTGERLASLDLRRGVSTLRLFARSIADFADRRLPRRFGFLERPGTGVSAPFPPSGRPPSTSRPESRASTPRAPGRAARGGAASGLR